MRFIVLINQLELSRDSLRTALTALIEQGFIEKNPGYGHPLRPEYILTERGIAIAVECQRLTGSPFYTEILSRKWSAPVIYALAAGCTRFNEIKDFLEVSPRALTQALRLLDEATLVQREVDDGYPPTTSYKIAKDARPLARQLGRIAASLES